MEQQFDMTVPGYSSLAAVLSAAFDQAARGKGKERHAANDIPFEEQPMQLIADKRGIGFILGQADKKSEEAQGMLDRGELDAAKREILGAIVYLAGSIIHIDRHAPGGGLQAEYVNDAPETVHKYGEDGYVVKSTDRHIGGYLLADGSLSGQYNEGDMFRIVRNDRSDNIYRAVGNIVTLECGNRLLWFTTPSLEGQMPVSWWKLVPFSKSII